jgi:hypothetical protein
MSVNAIVDNFSVQEMAAGSNQAAASEMREIDKRDGEKRLDDRSYTQKLLEAKASNKLGREVLTDLVSKLAGSGIKLNAETFVSKAQRQVKDEHDLMFQDQEETSDSVDIKSVHQKISAAKKLNQNLKDGKGGQEQNGSAEIQKMAGTLEEYSGALVQLLISGGTELKKKVERFEQQLRSEGFTEKELLGLQQNVRQSVRAQLMNQIKESLLKRFFSRQKTVEWVMNDKEAYKTIEFALNSDKLGNWDFGGYKTDLQEAVNEQIEEIRSQLRDFVKDELKTVLVKKHLGDSQADSEIKELVHLGLKTGIDFDRFMAHCTRNNYDVGITPPPPEAFGQSLLEFGMQDKKERTGYEFNQEDEKELLVNQLRALYMQRAVRGNLRTQIETAFRVRKLKNGLVKLGITFADFEKIEMEGVAVGRAKLLEMLKEAYYEGATLYELAGPAFTLIEKKKKGLLKNLERLGMDLSKTELDSIRDQANFALFDTARSELENTIILYEANSNPGLEKKIKLTIKLMKRLREESKIDTDYDPEKRFAQTASAV